MRRAVVQALILTMSAIVTPLVANAGGPLELRAYLAGQPIALDAVARYHCHDREYPVIDCFATEQERDHDAGLTPRAVAVAAAPDSSLFGAINLASAVFYVTFYEHSNFAGASYATSQAIAHLGLIGWNDAISSFKSLNGQRPKWWQDIDFAYFSWQWPASYWVSYVGDGANDRFSSVKNVP